MNGSVSEGLTIGEFGRRSGLSIKALRLYEVSGLLPPIGVDPVTGYRRYSADQLDRARRISLLRRLDMPLATVAEVLDGSDEQAVRHLDQWWAAQEAAMEGRRNSLFWLRARLLHGGTGVRTYAVHARSVPETKIATIQYEVDQPNLVSAVRDGEWRIRRNLAEFDVQVTEEHWVLFHGAVATDSPGLIEVCVPFTGLAQPVADMVVRFEPAHTEAFATVLRRDCFYPRIMQAYESVDQHVATEAMVPLGPVREIYLAAWESIEAADPFVLVAQPVDAAR